MRLYPFERIDDTVNKCLIEAKVKPSEGDDLGDAVASFVYTVGASNRQPNELLQEAAETLKGAHDERAIELVVRFLSDVLAASGLLLAAKATALYEDNERLLLDSRLIVDVRPIFEPRLPTSIAATVVLYKLRMSIRSPHSGDIDTMVLTVREEELKELGKAVGHAIEKAGVVRQARPFGVALVESQDDDR
jgi:hypothetical protein